MKYKENDIVQSVIDKPQIKKGLIGTVVCTFTIPNEAYEVEFNINGEYVTEVYICDEIVKMNK